MNSFSFYFYAFMISLTTNVVDIEVFNYPVLTTQPQVFNLNN